MKSEPEQIFAFDIFWEQTAVERQSSLVSLERQPPAFSHL